MNKVIVHRKCNLEKGSRTVNEWLEESDPDRFNQIKAKAKSLNLPSPKYNRIALGEINLEDFVQRQLNDTAYMSRQTANFLKSLGPEVKVRIANGKLTHTFRHHWGLNELLNSDDSKKKNRNDHRHHAIDAVVVALTDAKAFYNFAKTKGIGFEPKIPHIRQQLSERLQSMIVSHKPTRKIAGAYHEETFYGATEKAAPGEEQPKTRPWAKDWTESRTAFVRRLPIEAFNTKKVKNLEDIRDATIKDILLDYAGLKGVDTKDSKASLKGVFSLDDPPVMPSGVPIRRVRCLVKSETMEPVSQKRAYQNIQSGNNHHIAYFEKTKKGKKIWEAKVVSVLALVKHLKNRDTNGTGKLHAERPVLTLCKNDLFTFVDKNDEEQIGKVRKFDKKSARVDYCLHNDARPAKELTPENLFIFPNAMRDKNSSRIFITILGKRRTITEPWL